MPSIDNKKKSQQNKILYIFLTAFFVSLVTIIYLATAFTPEIDVDVNTGSEEYVSDGPKHDIDSRLRELQQDELIGAVPRTETESSTEIIEQLKRLKEEAITKQMKQDEIELETTNTASEVPQTPKPNLAVPTSPKPTASTPAKMAKVYVGRYSTFDDAIKVQDALVQSSLASAPFIKNMGSYYVIQIGSYANQQTAQNIAENLIGNGYSARMVLE